MTEHYDDAEILSLISCLGKGNPGRDAEFMKVLERIMSAPRESGLSEDTLERIARALRKE